MNFERRSRINAQKGTNVEHLFQNNNIRKNLPSFMIYHINRYIGVTKQVSSVCAFQVFHPKTEKREVGCVTPKCSL